MTTPSVVGADGRPIEVGNICRLEQDISAYPQWDLGAGAYVRVDHMDDTHLWVYPMVWAKEMVTDENCAMITGEAVSRWSPLA